MELATKPRGGPEGIRVGVDGAPLAGTGRDQPWQFLSWIFPPYPGFAVKAGRVLELYERNWDGQPLGEDEYVVSAGEKPQLQALSRCHPGLADRRRPAEFESERGGTLAYVVAYGVYRAKLAGMITSTGGIAPFSGLVGKVMTAEPYTSAKRVFPVVDNGSSHAGQDAPISQRPRSAWSSCSRATWSPPAP